MNRKGIVFLPIFVAIPLIFLFNACSHNGLSDSLETSFQKYPKAREVAVADLALPDELADPQMEFSGMALYQELVVLLPQYPHRFARGSNGSLFAVPVENFIESERESNNQFDYSLIAFDDDALSKTLPGFEGFEALVFLENEVYLTIETSGGSPMKAFLVKGSLVETEMGELSVRLDASQIVELEVQNSSRNASFEALTSDGEYLYAFFEQNGSRQNSDPRVLKIDKNLNIVGEYPIDPINYRVTDATLIDQDGSLWLINYFFPGDEHLRVENDELAERYKLPGSHARDTRVERLVKLRLQGDAFVLADEPPLYLELLSDGTARNWEGLVRLDGIGFVLITDKFPGSILGLVRPDQFPEK
jgi:hypothetical protein